MDFDKLNIIIEHNLDFFIGISFMTIPTFTENYILHSGIIYPTSGIYYLIFLAKHLHNSKIHTTFAAQNHSRVPWPSG